MFWYILISLKKLVYNNKILKLFTKNFKNFNKKCYVINTKYHNTDYLLYLYYNICYYLNE